MKKYKFNFENKTVNNFFENWEEEGSLSFYLGENLNSFIDTIKKLIESYPVYEDPFNDSLIMVLSVIASLYVSKGEINKDVTLDKIHNEVIEQYNKIKNNDSFDAEFFVSAMVKRYLENE